MYDVYSVQGGSYIRLLHQWRMPGEISLDEPVFGFGKLLVA